MNELSPLELDTISEVGNISLGASATALSAIIDRRVSITTPCLTLLTVADVKERFPVPCVVAEVNYTAGLQGSNVLLIKEKDAQVIAALMMGSPPEDTEKPLGEIELSAIQEAMNQMMGLMATSMSDMFNRRINISPPLVDRRNLAIADPALRGLHDDDPVVEVAFKMSVEDLIDSTLVQLIPLESARDMALFLLGEETAAEQDSEKPFADEVEPAAPQEVAAEGILAAAAAKWQDEEPVFTQAEPVRLGLPENLSFTAENNPDDAVLEKLDMVKDLPIDVTVILGATRISLGALFDLEKGGIIDLDGYIDTPVELLVNGKLMAHGEVVMVDEHLGVKITKMQMEPE